MQSGAFALTQQPLAQAEAAGVAFADSLEGDDQSARFLRRAPAAELVSKFPFFAIPGVVDGKVLTESVGSAIANGRFARVPILNGSVHDEEATFVASQLAVSNGCVQHAGRGRQLRGHGVPTGQVDRQARADVRLRVQRRRRAHPVPRRR